MILFLTAHLVSLLTPNWDILIQLPALRDIIGFAELALIFLICVAILWFTIEFVIEVQIKDNIIKELEEELNKLKKR